MAVINCESSTSKSNAAGLKTTHFPASLSAVTSSACLPFPSLKTLNSITSDSPGAIVLNPDPSLLRVTPVSNSSTETLIVLSSLAVSSPLEVTSISMYTFPSS